MNSKQIVKWFNDRYKPGSVVLFMDGYMHKLHNFLTDGEAYVKNGKPMIKEKFNKEPLIINKVLIDNYDKCKKNGCV